MKKAVLILIIVVAILIFAPVILVRLAGVSMFLVNVLALPLILLVLLWFVYRLWGKPYFRAWHIARIRNARYMKEAVTRGKEG